MKTNTEKLKLVTATNTRQTTHSTLNHTTYTLSKNKFYLVPNKAKEILQ